MNENKNENIEFGRSSDKGSLFGILLILLALVAYVFFARPVSADVSSMRNEVASKQHEVEEVRSEIERYEQAQEELELATEVQRRASLRAVPVEMDQDEVIRDLLNIAGDNGVTLRSVSFSRGSSGMPGIGVLRVNAGFEGDYNELTSFLEGLETNTRIFRVASINVQVRQLDFADLERASFSLGIETFYQQ